MAPQEPFIRHYDCASDILYVGGASIEVGSAVLAVRDVVQSIQAWRFRWESAPAATA